LPQLSSGKISPFSRLGTAAGRAGRLDRAKLSSWLEADRKHGSGLACEVQFLVAPSDAIP
jgi:hypothetical protein